MFNSSPFLRRGVKYLRRSMLAGAGVDVFYDRSGERYIVKVVPKRPQSNQVTDEGLLIDDISQDFFIRKSDLELSPIRGDVIVWDDRYFEVLHAGGGREVEEAGNYGDTWRVHCKIIPTPPDVLVDEGYASPSGEVYGTFGGTGYGASP